MMNSDRIRMELDRAADNLHAQMTEMHRRRVMGDRVYSCPHRSMSERPCPDGCHFHLVPIKEQPQAFAVALWRQFGREAARRREDQLRAEAFAEVARRVRKRARRNRQARDKRRLSKPLTP